MQVYSMNGTNVAILLQDELNIGEHSINWSGCDDSGARLPTGIYFYRLMLNNNIYLGKIVLKYYLPDFEYYVNIKQCFLIGINIKTIYFGCIIFIIPTGIHIIVS